MEINKYEEFENIYSFDDFDEKFKKLFGKTKRAAEKELNWLYKKLCFLENNPDFLNDDEFKAIKNSGKYTIRRISKKGKHNQRVIYYVHENEKVLLLVPFFEKNKSDYEKNIQKAINLLKQIEGDII